MTVATTAWPWPAPIDDGSASHLIPGLKFPSVSLPATSTISVNLAEVQGISVVAIYPWTGGPGRDNPPGWDDIPGAHGSTPQLQGFRRLTHSFQEIGINVYGVSAQPSDEQREFAELQELPFPLLSDHQYTLQCALCLPTFQAGNMKFLSRLTLVLNEGVLQHAFYPVHPPGKHVHEVLHWCGANHP